ncbi:Dipeptidyl aminopeptidase/acylaminoacyl-peptidase [Halanaeroarchaeum sp. HSR-CO]|uniref:S9 family peptidase n=1 Tax=Halanaeroarchaeum sp. HSR-CO TaxID=2866382 RepID=UPI00217E2CF8|nr:S9 family peptidase [Halanaeroarchaeum sp. HSR-CO]UWG47343.1 Dipeptidyl aminopeptidase/acylaminoacyl-peptidase [Halanaeroarchaeum sp. HSR-CO]
MSFDIERYLNVRSAYGPSLGVDGGLAFLMDTTGVPQVWRLDEPGEWPAQLTFDEERVAFVAASPTRPEFVYGKDEGGDEKVQLFRLAADGSKTTPLTDRPSAKHRWGGWSNDGDRFAFASNRRDESVFDVYVQGRDERGDDATLVHEGDGWLSVVGWSPDDDRLLVHEAHSSFDHDVFVLEVETGQFEHLTPHEGNVRYGSVEWGPDGESVFVCTDANADTLELARMDVTEGEMTVVESGGDWNVEAVTIHQESGRIAYSRNVEGYTELTTGRVDGATVTEQRPFDLPTGVLGGFDFGPDAQRLAVSLTASTDTANVHVFDLPSERRTRWTRAATAGIPRDTFREPDIVRYDSFDDLTIPALFTTPDASTPPYPVIVDVHGGPESQRRPSFNPVKQYFLAQGYAYFEPNVRGSTGYGKAYTHLDDVRKRMDAVRDVREGAAWLRSRADIDEDRIVAMGGSYGGFVVLAALTEYPDVWAAGVDIVGIANFITFLQNTGDWRRSLREAEYGSLEADREFLADISPINNIESIEAPLLVLHGRNDPRVPVGEAEQIAEEAAKHVPVETRIFDDEGHGFTKLENRIEAYRTIVDFLGEYV